MEVNKVFMDFLNSNPEALLKFVEIMKVFIKLQFTAPPPVKLGDGPHEWKFEEEHRLTTVPISLEDIEALEKGYAEATKKEKIMEYVKGFITGVMFKGGGLV